MDLLLLDLLQSYLPARDLRSSKKNLLAVPAFNINSHGSRAYSVAAPASSLEQSSSALGMLDHWTLKKKQEKLFFLDALWCFYILNYFIFSFCREKGAL